MKLLTSKFHGAEIELSAPYVAEIARAWMVERYGEEAYTSGMKVYTRPLILHCKNQPTTAAINNLLSLTMNAMDIEGRSALLWHARTNSFRSLNK